MKLLSKNTWSNVGISYTTLGRERKIERFRYRERFKIKETNRHNGQTDRQRTQRRSEREREDRRVTRVFGGMQMRTRGHLLPAQPSHQPSQ